MAQLWKVGWDANSRKGLSLSRYAEAMRHMETTLPDTQILA